MILGAALLACILVQRAPAGQQVPPAPPAVQAPPVFSETPMPPPSAPKKAPAPRETAPAVPGATAPAGEAHAGGPLPQIVPPVALLTRVADPVAYLDAEARAEKFLWHWQKMQSMRVGDGVRQGVAGISEVHFTRDQGELRLWGDTQAFLTSSNPKGHVLEFRSVSRARIHAREYPMVLKLPGGTELKATDTVFVVSLTDMSNRYEVRNSGPGEIELSGPVLPPGTRGVPAGNSILLPLLVEPLAVSQEPTTLDVWQGSSLRLESGVSAQRAGDRLVLDGEGLARVGGARIRVEHGQQVNVWKPRR